MKNGIKHSLIATAALLFVVSCDPKDIIFNTPHPDHGTVTLTTDWSGIGEGLQVPAIYEVHTTSERGGEAFALTGSSNKLDRLFDPGKLRINVYNPAEHVSVHVGLSYCTVTVPEVSGNWDGVGKFVHNAPDWLFTSVIDVMIYADTEQSVTAVMQQQVRQLTLIIEPTGGTTDRIERIEGYLTGVASQLDLLEGTHKDPRNVELQFVRIASGPDAGKWSATVRLLGTAGASQQLNVRIHFNDDIPAAVDLESDLTPKLAKFNDDKRTPLTLGGQLVETPTGAGFGATITDWKPVDGGEVSAD